MILLFYSKINFYNGCMNMHGYTSGADPEINVREGALYWLDEGLETA